MSRPPKIRIRVVMHACELQFEVGIKRRFFWKNGRVFDTEEQARNYINQYIAFSDVILPVGI